MSRPSRKLLEQRKELIDRYVRRKVMRIGRSVGRRIGRVRLRWSERERMKALVSTLGTIATEAARARRNGLEAMTVVLNLALFFLIAERDIQAVKIDALTHPDPWERGLAARVMLLTIHELEIDKAAGGKLRQALDDGNVPVELRDAITEAMRAIRRAQQHAQRRFSYLRNATIAHRDSDAIRQYRDILGIDGLELTKIAVEFYAGTHRFIEVVPALLAHLGSGAGLISQLSAQIERRERVDAGRA